MIVGVDASRNRSGGAIAHLRGIFEFAKPQKYGIEKIHLWAYDELLALIDNYAWLEKHEVPSSKKGILNQLAWQYFQLEKSAKKLDVDVMFNTDAGSVCSFYPSVTLSQDMLSFEKGEMQRYPVCSLERVRLEILRGLQLRSLRKSALAIFLTNYAACSISRFAKVKNCSVIPHGIDRVFFEQGTRRRKWPSEGPIECVYVSNIDLYKHQWNVIQAFYLLRKKNNVDLRLSLVGSVNHRAKKKLDEALKRYDPDNNFVRVLGGVKHEKIPHELQKADFFLFASSCENLPITLLEAMASSLPVVSSNKGPMPEVLGDATIYFDPENVEEIVSAVKTLLFDEKTRLLIKNKALNIANTYSWEKCADLTWEKISQLQ